MAPRHSRPEAYHARIVVPPGASIGMRRAAPEQLHQFVGHRAAAETRGAGAVEHDEVAAFESAREVLGHRSRELNSSVEAFSRDSAMSSWFCRLARRSSASNQRENSARPTGNEHRERDDAATAGA